MRIYYKDAEYEADKHKILNIWLESRKIAMPEDDVNTAINVSYSVLELDERYNRRLAKLLLANEEGLTYDGEIFFDRYYVNNSGEIVDNDTDTVVTINPNPQKEDHKLSALYGMTQEQLETYIDNNVTNLAEAKVYLKRLSAVVLWLVKETQLDE